MKANYDVMICGWKPFLSSAQCISYKIRGSYNFRYHTVQKLRLEQVRSYTRDILSTWGQNDDVIMTSSSYLQQSIYLQKVRLAKSGLISCFSKILDRREGKPKNNKNNEIRTLYPRPNNPRVYSNNKIEFGYKNGQK